MQELSFRFDSPGGVRVFVYEWAPDPGAKARGVVQIAHGMAEHAGRYRRVAERLVASGYRVYANDHRGHGRTASTPDELGCFAERDGWTLAVGDLARLGSIARRENPGLPVFLLGHSMGSLLAQQYLIDHGDALAGAVLSGSTGGRIAPERLEAARAERRRLGPRGRSETLTGLSFGAFNAAFAPARTDFDWLSRDAAEVDAYVADPLCGFAVSAQLWIDLLEGIAALAAPEGLACIPRGLPIYVFSGERDPVHGNGVGLELLESGYRSAGLTRVRRKIYPGGRHEMFNETNRDEVIADLILWLDGTA